MKQLVIFVCLVLIAQVAVFAGGNQDRNTRQRSIENRLEQVDTDLKNAIDMLAEGLQNPTDTIIGPFSLADTDIPSGMSLFLAERVRHHAENNHEGKYNIIIDGFRVDHNQVASITGYFSQAGKQVDVTLELNTPDSTGDRSVILSISAELLVEILGVAIVPENLDEIQVIQEILEEVEIIVSDTPTEASAIAQTQGITIQAFFDSESRTFFHRDELKMSVMANRNCYFKVIHIDANNQIKMIYPNSYDKNNQLRANTARSIFETASYMLYEPYGAETIIIVASTDQFPNIEQEYITPWTAATTESIRAAVRGTRGGDLETRIRPPAGEGEVVYTITILKPHEEFEYERPEDMREMFEAIRDDALSQGGTFEGNETSGFYVTNGIRGSYRVPRETPNRVQFTLYYLDNYTGGRNAGVRTRGAGFTFSFSKPENISQAVQSVRSGIVSNGGTFSGNNQQGNFQASGITGQYRVADMVNVTITEKPFLVPNSLIEREVKGFFGER
ncbi:MAG: DUF4384 domain-containing protein [Bacteroidales bacterium]|nr:DUF4384 domain-containing protein [Bacteroidales bacterium]